MHAPASPRVLEFYNQHHAGDGSGIFSDAKGKYKKGGAKKHRTTKKAYDDSGNEHVGANQQDNKARVAREKKDTSPNEHKGVNAQDHAKSESDKFTKVANDIAKRDGITPAAAARNLGNLLKSEKNKADAKRAGLR